MKSNTIGVNLYSIRRHCQSAGDLDATLERIGTLMENVEEVIAKM